MICACDKSCAEEKLVPFLDWRVRQHVRKLYTSSIRYLFLCTPVLSNSTSVHSSKLAHMYRRLVCYCSTSNHVAALPTNNVTASYLGFSYEGLESKIHITQLSPLDKKAEITSFLFWAKRGVLLEPSSSTPLMHPCKKKRHIQLFTLLSNVCLSLLDHNSYHKSPSTAKTNKFYVRPSSTYT